MTYLSGNLTWNTLFTMKTFPQSNLILLAKQLYRKQMNYSAFDILQFHLLHCWPAPPQPSSRLQDAYCPQNDAFFARVYELTASSSAMAGEVKVWVSSKPIQQPWEFYTGGGGVNDRKCWYLKINFMTRHNIIIHKHFNDWYLEYKDGLTDGKISRKKVWLIDQKQLFSPALS